MALAVARVDLGDEPGRHRVDHRDTHAVEAAGDLVATAAELAAGVQDREHDFEGRLALLGARGHRLDGNAAAVVLDPAAAVGEQA